MTDRPGYWRIMARAWRLRCPRCGKGRLFRGWARMNPECSECGLKYEREPGFFLGSTYVNYGVTAILVTALYFAGFFSEVLSSEQLLATLTVFCVVFPLWFYRYARSIWLAFDQYWDPQPLEKAKREPGL